MQGENYNHIFQELIRLSLKRIVLICGDTDIDFYDDILLSHPAQN